MEAGVDCRRTQSDQGGQVDEQDLIGRHVHIEVVEDTYEGKTRLKVKEVMSPVGVDVPIDPVEPAASGGGDTEPADLDEVPF